MAFLETYYGPNDRNEWDIGGKIPHLRDPIFLKSLVLPVPTCLSQDHKSQLCLKNVHRRILLKLENKEKLIDKVKNANKIQSVSKYFQILTHRIQFSI